MSDTAGQGTITPPEGSRARIIHDAIQRHDIRLSPDGRIAPACSVSLATEIDEILAVGRYPLGLSRATEIEAIGWVSAELAARSGAWDGNAPDWFPQPPEWLELWDRALAAVGPGGLRDNPHIPKGYAEKIEGEFATPTAMRKLRGEHAIQEPERGPRSHPGDVGVPGDGWKGTRPAQGTRRALILDAVERVFDGSTSPAPPSDVSSLEVADAIESALLASTIDDEAMARGAEALTAGIEKEKVDLLRSTSALTFSIPIHALLDSIAIPRNEYESGDGPRRILTLHQRVEILVRRYSKAVTVDGSTAYVYTREDDAAKIDVAKVHNLLDGWEVVRSEEGKVLSLHQRAYRLTQRLAHAEDEVRHEIDANGEAGSDDDGREADAQEAINAVVESLNRLDAPDGPTAAKRVERLYRELRESIAQPEKLERLEKQAVRLDEICEERWKCIGDLEDRLKRVHELATDTAGPPRQLCDLHADLAEIAGIARADYPAGPAEERAAEQTWPEGSPERRLVERRNVAAAGEESDEDAARRMAKELIEVTASADRLHEEREEARVGEGSFKAQRDAALNLLRWLIGEVLPPPGDDIDGEGMMGRMAAAFEPLFDKRPPQDDEGDGDEDRYDDSEEPLWKIEVERGLNHLRNAIAGWIGL